ncbi:MAG: homocysteine S-methyltransferase family protein, partial [Fibrobacterales bacterium]|nr:homocysteine S-methyltransferase family protein [Fibrobacterales bacterium]
MKKSEAWAALEEADSSRVLVLDGAMGTMIQRHGLTEADYNDGRFEASVPLKGNNELLSLTRPDVILSIHRAYLEAGADIVETNTFNANRISQRDYGQEGRVAELNLAAAKLARQAVDEAMAKDPSRRRFVAGSMGPTNQTASMSPRVEDPGFRAVDFDALEEAFREQARALLEGGVDILLVETAFDALNVKAALCAIRSVCAERGELVPIMVSGTISDASGRLLTGPTLEALYASVRHAEIYSIGLNCALGAAAMRPHVETLARIAECRVSAHPNAGLPNQFGQYDQDAKGMRAELESFVDRRLVNVLGGCCGTDPTFIREIADLVRGRKPREVPKLPERTLLAGTDVLEISERSNFVNVGERTNVSGSAKFRKLIEQENYAEALG